jgi:ABC-type transport system involved in multi-copper enzyme maturation permease subunit
VLNLLRRLTARHALFLAVSIILLGGFEYLICALVSTVDISGAAGQIIKSLPPSLRSMLGEEFLGGLTTRGILAFGWNHPIALALGAAIAIVLATRGIAGEIENGAMELMLSQPLSRMNYFAAHVGFALLALATLSLSGWLGTAIGQHVFDLNAFAPGNLFRLVVNFFLLQSAWLGITLLLSVFGRERGRVAGAAFFLALISYLVQVIGRLWPAAAFLLPFSLYTYYSPPALLVESRPVGKSLVILFSAIAVSLGSAAWRFQRRDIP